MNRARQSLAVTCLALVMLPMPPCAFLPGVCKTIRAAVATSALVPAHSCCASSADDESRHASQSPHKDKPCPRGCCRLYEIAPVAEKVVAEQSLAWLSVAPTELADSIDTACLNRTSERLPPADSLQSLHCLWRC